MTTEPRCRGMTQQQSSFSKFFFFPRCIFSTGQEIVAFNKKIKKKKSFFEKRKLKKTFFFKFEANPSTTNFELVDFLTFSKRFVRCCSAAVEHSSRDQEVEGLNPAGLFSSSSSISCYLTFHIIINLRVSTGGASL